MHTADGDSCFTVYAIDLRHIWEGNWLLKKWSLAKSDLLIRIIFGQFVTSSNVNGNPQQVF